jgi:hypothetical protein
VSNPLAAAIRSTGKNEREARELEAAALYQGTTSVVPQMQLNRIRALAPEGMLANQIRFVGDVL